MKQTGITLIVAAVGACSAEPHPVGESTGALVAASCRPDVRVGVPSAGATCPAPTAGSGWTVSYLFTDPAVIHAGGHPFCLYTHSSPSGSFSTAGLPADPGSGVPGDAWTDPDCLGVTALQAETEPTALELVTEAHVHAYRAQVGRPNALPEAPGLPQPVTVAILDSSVDSEPVEVEPTTGEYLHGRAISLAIRDSTCPNGRDSVCIPDFDTHLVLDQGGDPLVPGGHYGSIATLAQKIEQAVLDGGSRLVIPLAVGWHPRYQHRNADTSERESHGVHAVRAALDWATCEGALVLAAAGNRGASGGDDGSEPLCPACWETLGSSCDPEKPIVYAAGAVNPSQSPIALTREGGVARLQGAGFAVSVEGVAGTDEQPLGIWTGTSMGVASVATAATLAWGYQPSLTNHDIASALYDAGKSLDVEAEFCLFEECGVARRIDACTALIDALAMTCPHCDPRCETDPEARVVLGEEHLDVLLSRANEELLVEEPVVSESIEGTGCEGVVYGDGSYDEDQPYCPWQQGDGYASAPDVLDPQPDPDGCGVCAVFTAVSKSGDLLYLDIRENFAGVLADPTLTIPGYGTIAVGDAMSSSYLVAGDTVAVPLGASSISYSSPILSFVSYPSPGSQKGVVVSAEIPVY